MPKEKKIEKKSEKKIGGLSPEVMTYQNQERPALEYSDFVRLDASPDGVIFSFGQTHPRRKTINITHEIVVPLRVAGALHNILGDQINSVLERIREIQDLGQSDETKK